MTQGCLLFAHDGKLDYGSQAVLAAKLAVKHLAVPVSLVTDQTTLDNIHRSFDQLPFDQIILVDKPKADNKRYLSNGDDSEIVEFINSNRSTAYSLTPYDRTLLLDTDFLILSNSLSRFWNDASDFLITVQMIDLTYLGHNQRHSKLSQYSIDMLWATNIMFTKNEQTKLIFDLVEHIKEHYHYYGRLYDFDSTQYRNDFAFSVACHILGGHGSEKCYSELPSPIFIRDVDQLINVNADQLTFLLKDYNIPDNYNLLKTVGQDVHMMNKRCLLDNLDRLMELANV
jgi:hypothetical protein